MRHRGRSPGLRVPNINVFQVGQFGLHRNTENTVSVREHACRVHSVHRNTQKPHRNTQKTQFLSEDTHVEFITVIGSLWLWELRSFLQDEDFSGCIRTAVMQRPGSRSHRSACPFQVTKEAAVSCYTLCSDHMQSLHLSANQLFVMTVTHESSQIPF